MRSERIQRKETPGVVGPIVPELSAREAVQKQAVRGMSYAEGVQFLSPIQQCEDRTAVHAPTGGTVQRKSDGHAAVQREVGADPIADKVKTVIDVLKNEARQVGAPMPELQQLSAMALDAFRQDPQKDIQAVVRELLPTAVPAKKASNTKKAK